MVALMNAPSDFRNLASAFAAGDTDQGKNTLASALTFFNGASFDRARGDIANGLDVDVTRSALPAGAATDATLTGGTAKAIARGGVKGATVAADVTSTAEGADHQAQDVQLYHGGVAVDPRDILDRATRALGAVSAAAGASFPDPPSILAVTNTAAAAAIVTLTLPAAGAGLFHYITSLEITAYTTVARTGAAAPILVTSTNLPGNPVWDFATAAAIGTTDKFVLVPATPLRSSAANTATTIVGPGTASIIWRINVTYFTAA